MLHMESPLHMQRAFFFACNREWFLTQRRKDRGWGLGVGDW